MGPAMPERVGIRQTAKGISSRGSVPTRLALIIASMEAGGAERVMSILANHWATNGRSVHLYTLAKGAPTSFYDLHSSIIYRSLGGGKRATPLLDTSQAAGGAPSGASLRLSWRMYALGALTPAKCILFHLRRVFALRRAVIKSQPDAVIAFCDRTNIYTLLATVGLRISVIVSERYDPNAYPIARGWSLARRWTYPWAACVVTQTRAALGYFSPRVQRRGRIIPNPVFIPPFLRPGSAQLSASPDRHKIMIAIGRLAPQKGFDLLLEAFGRIAPQHPEWTLEIWGDGPLRESLEAVVGQLELQGRVRLPGTTKEPWQKMREADLFVLSSRFEGFPNVLCEAMACGLPVISFDCPSGPSEIIRDGIDGVLVPAGDVDALEAAISRLMDHPEERERLAARAPEVLDRFGLGKVMAVWDQLIDEARK